MGVVHVQLQSDRLPTDDVAGAIDLLLAVDRTARVTSGEDDGQYVNFEFKSDDPAALWRAIRALLAMHRFLAPVTIVTCEGRHGWDDFLLLHHFDGTLTLDELPGAGRPP
jgi:hypothetical protein